MTRAHLYTDGGDFVAVVEIPPETRGYPFIVIYRGGVYVRFGDPDTDLYHEVIPYLVPETKETAWTS